MLLDLRYIETNINENLKYDRNRTEFVVRILSKNVMKFQIFNAYVCLISRLVLKNVLQREFMKLISFINSFQ